MVLRKNQSGFTLVELLIVIVVIGILATLVITTYSGIQSKARDTKRQTDINAIQGQLEAYYAQNGNYPTNDNMESSVWIGGDGTSTNPAHLKGLDLNALQTPKWSSSSSCKDATTGKAVTTSSTSSLDCYQYSATADDGSACTNASGNDCTKYTLSAKLENGSTPYTKSSLN
ncbi:MAG TPA: type II secretion system protein [Candidatus Saccharimonadales bacterium]|jgi:general secretion pathway protein G|nr:type II secretion system protein [Candidatus Saccharimonadales bacterium]